MRGIIHFTETIAFTFSQAVDAFWASSSIETTHLYQELTALRHYELIPVSAVSPTCNRKKEENSRLIQFGPENYFEGTIAPF